MQKAITLTIRNNQTMRGMEHIPEHVSGPFPAVILCHGFTANKLQEHRMFLKLCRELERIGMACFRYDFIGSGESDGDFVDMTVSNEIQEAKAILESVKSDPRIDSSHISLLGLSMGGLVAGAVAGDCPNDVQNLVLISAAGNMSELMMAGTAGNLYRASTWIPEAADASGNLFSREFIEDLLSIDGFERAKRFPGDVLIVHGTNDESVSYQVANRYQDASFGGRATLHFIEGADHTFNRYAWEREMIETVRDFLGARI